MKNTKTKRFITIARKTDNKDGRSVRLPFLRITGKWFQQAGFDIGDIAEVNVEDGCLVIRKTNHSWRVERRGEVEVEKFMVNDAGERIA